jgi:peptide/nickel transport system substrate-binding protein
MWLRRGIFAVGAFTVWALGSGATLSYFEESIPTTLNPLYAETMADHRAQELIFDRLWYHDAITNEIRTRLIQVYEVAEAGRAVKITLKDGIKWQDGSNLTSKDVCFTVNALLNPRTPSPMATTYRDFLAGCDTQGPASALIRFKRVLPNPRERLGFPVLPASQFSSTSIAPDSEFSARPIGTGPFNGKQGRRAVSFDAFANVHHDPKIVQLQLQEGGDPLIQTRTLINNNVQGIVVVPPPQRPDLRASDDVALKSYDLRSWWFIAVNTSNPTLGKKEVRQALNLILDRNDLREFTTGVRPGDKNSPCEFISGPFVQSSPYYNRTIEVSETADRGRADNLLQSAGLEKVGGRWHDGGAPIVLKIGMLANLNNEAPDLLEYIGNQLGDAGFDRQTAKVGQDEWKQEVIPGNSNFDLVIGKWSFGLVEEVYDLFHSSGRKNIFSFTDGTVDGILDEYENAITDTEQKDAYHKLHARLADELPYLFLWKLDTKSAWRTEVQGNIVAPYYYFTEIDSWNVDG